MPNYSYYSFTLFYLLFCVCFIFRTNVFVSAGITVEFLLGKFLVSEHDQFILHHIQRTSYTLLVHSLLPLGYSIAVLFFVDDTPDWLLTSKVVNILALGTIIFPAIVSLFIWNWFKNECENHPIAHKLSVFCDHTSSWRVLSSDINSEFKRVDKINLQCSTLQRVIASDNWLIKVTPYTMCVAHQSDSVLVLTKSDTHAVSVLGTSNGTVQYLTIEVKTTRRNAENFIIRCNALDFKDLEEKIHRPITILQDVTFHRSRTDLFLEVFRNTVEQNPIYRATQAPEMCIGCMVSPSNVKLVKYCGDTTSTDRSCINCYCRPMWCVDCMGKWWASRQEQDRPETWLSSKCSCPVCRSIFCMRDICAVEWSDS